jgi:uncharacterized protein (DUF2236 family)
VSSIARRVNAQRILVLSWPRAILLQLAHPLVAAGVMDHSSFRRGPLTAVRRLHETVRAMLSLTFGDRAEHERSIERILAIHRRVNGTLRQPVGSFEAGTRYSAEDPDLVLWVHVTLIESVIIFYERVVAPLDEAERDTYCDEAAIVAEELGASSTAVPRTWPALLEYLDATHRSGRIAVGPDARAVAGAVLEPPSGWLAWPLTRLNRTVTLGLLPAEVRSQYGYGWTERQERAFARDMRWLAASRRWAPSAIALWPEARL